MNAGWYYATDSHKFDTNPWENDDQYLNMAQAMTVDVTGSINYFWTGASLTSGLGVFPWSSLKMIAGMGCFVVITLFTVANLAGQKVILVYMRWVIIWDYTTHLKMVVQHLVTMLMIHQTRQKQIMAVPHQTTPAAVMMIWETIWIMWMMPV